MVADPVAAAGVRMLIAITREVSPSLNECELTHLDRRPIDDP